MYKRTDTGTKYYDLVNKEFEKLQTLQRRRDELDLEIAKSRQFIAATANMLTDRQRDTVLQRIRVIEGERMIAEAGLTDAIRSVLKQNSGEWLTVTQVRDKLESAGFDFSSYKSSPLASISTTLKRLKAEDVETTEIDGVAAYRWIGKIRMEAPKSSGLHAAFYGEPPTRLSALREVLKDSK
ncbi:MAG TPA: hypothetical protein VH114_08970 [Candidatus Acidoferrum sp.]|jgi:hypothetical protein|nr:hypothetical protein [Candidatus Acidoferrum sp.]